MQLWTDDFRGEEPDNLLGVTDRHPFRALCDVVPMPCDGPVITLSKESNIRNALESHPRGMFHCGQGRRIIEFGHSDYPAHGAYRPPGRAKYFRTPLMLNASASASNGHSGHVCYVWRNADTRILAEPRQRGFEQCRSGPFAIDRIVTRV